MQNEVKVVFEQTTVHDVAGELANQLGRASPDDMDTFEKLRLMQYAAGLGKEELTDVLIAMLPHELRLPAALLYDQVCLQ